MIHTYIDGSLFNKGSAFYEIIPPDSEYFNKIYNYIMNDQMIIPFSNAHINDLVTKHQDYADESLLQLSAIKKLSNNLCLVNYWDENKMTWHYRDSDEFFRSTLKCRGTQINSLEGLLINDKSGFHSKIIEQLRLERIPDFLQDIYLSHPVFSYLFPKTIAEMNLLAAWEDFFDFSRNAKKDYALWKSLKKYLHRNKKVFKHQYYIFLEIEKSFFGMPSLLFNDLFKPYSGPTEPSKCLPCDKIMDCCLETTFADLQEGDNFSTLTDNLLHVFYGAQCDYYLTADSRQYLKASKIFEELKLPTRTLYPQEFTL